LGQTGFLGDEEDMRETVDAMKKIQRHARELVT